MDEIRVVPYDPSWAESFALERDAILRVVRPVRVLHLGSTSVPGLAAKPIIDIFLTVERMEDAYGMLDALRTLGYVHVDIHEDDRLFMRKGMPRTHHLHIVAEGSETLMGHIAFRDALMRDTSRRDAYARLKLDLADRYANDREGYCEAKASFIEDVLEEACGRRG